MGDLVPSALEELNTRIDELKSDLRLVALAAQLRPRIGSIIRWDPPSDVVTLVKQFMELKSSRPEGVYGPLLVRLMALLERYLRSSVAQKVRLVSGARTYDDLASTLGNRNLMLTGRVLAAVNEPRDYLSFDIESLIENLASCRLGNASFRLNPEVFSATVTGLSPTIIDRALGYVDVKDWKDKLGANKELARLLGTKGARATGERACERLKELWRWRNHLAHGGDEEIALTEQQLQEAIDFVLQFGRALAEFC